MKEVTRYETSDGEVFDTAAEADMHETRIEDINLVNQYLDEQAELKPVTRTKAFKAIMGFMDWKNRDQDPAGTDLET